ncbi:MAG TPA: 2-oxo acid dehydrogenase subunit E2 [Myxococcota bacterium]|nr:2-oxo acid dehydrogenase subunit E2 [Myxococcota bacterium]HND33617.1 2-oxo acid dehydrogenase subunit E2 [Myxococcota bacterium]
MEIGIAVAVAALVVFVLLELKTSRPDGTMMNIKPFRRILLAIMPTRTESLVYFDEYIDATNLLPYIARARAAYGANMTHLCVAAAATALSANPAMNRFVAGNRLYQRNQRYISFSMKKQKLNRSAQLATVKMEIRDNESLRGFCARVNAQIGEERSGKKTKGDKEVESFNLLPRPLLRVGVPLFKMLDYYNLLPGGFIKDDPLYTSIFMANLGSLAMGAGYHHLFEYGSCPLFLMIGRVEQAPMVVDGEVKVRPRLHVRFTYDERIDDGLNARFGIEAMVQILKDPESFYGAPEDESAPPLWPLPEGKLVYGPGTDG